MITAIVFNSVLELLQFRKYLFNLYLISMVIYIFFRLPISHLCLTLLASQASSVPYLKEIMDVVIKRI